MLGYLAGIGTAMLWTMTALCFEESSRRIGSLAVNAWRLFVALALFVVLMLATRGLAFPRGLSAHSWVFLGLSGLVGFVIGDLLLFQAFVLIGSRLSMLIYSTVPIITALTGFFFFREKMGGFDIAGMVLAVAGVALAMVSRNGKGKGDDAETEGGTPDSSPDVSKPRRAPARVLGLLFAFGGALGQAFGLILAKAGAEKLDSFEATQVRVVFGLAGFIILALVSGKFSAITRPLGIALGLKRPTRNGTTAGARKDESSVAAISNGAAHAVSSAPAQPSERRRTVMAFVILSAGAFCGPFLGVSLGLVSARLLPTGTASTLMSLSPVFAIPLAMLAFGERPARREVAGAIIATAGVALMALS